MVAKVIALDVHALLYSALGIKLPKAELEHSGFVFALIGCQSRCCSLDGPYEQTKEKVDESSVRRTVV